AQQRCKRQAGQWQMLIPDRRWRGGGTGGRKFRHGYSADVISENSQFSATGSESGLASIYFFLIIAVGPAPVLAILEIKLAKAVSNGEADRPYRTGRTAVLVEIITRQFPDEAKIF